MRTVARCGLLLAAVAATACIDLTTDPDEIVAIEFQPLPWPAVVAGDTLRDSLGNVAALRARLFDGSGDEAEGEISFLAQEALVTITPGSLVVGNAGADGVAQLLATGAGLQSAVRRLEVVPRPDTMARDGILDTLRWVIPDDPAENTSPPLRARVLSRSATPPVGVRGWIVRWRLTFQGQPIAAGDTTKVWLVGDNGRPSTVDTTDGSGATARRIRVRSGPASGLGTLDSVIVHLETQERGQPLAGSPLRLVLPVKPRG